MPAISSAEVFGAEKGVGKGVTFSLKELPKIKQFPAMLPEAGQELEGTEYSRGSVGDF